jgi:hypothetical protein
MIEYCRRFSFYLALTITMTMCVPATAMAARTVKGKILDSNNRPAAGLLVKIWDEDDPTRGSADFMGQATTDANGNYSFTWPEGKIWDPPKTDHHTQWRPDIYIEVFAKSMTGNHWAKTLRVPPTSNYKDHPHRDDLTINGTVPPNTFVKRETKFIPEHHGFPFENKAFAVCAAPTCKDEHSRMPLAYFEKFYNFKWALCGGMSLNALKRFRNGIPPAPLSPELKEDLIADQILTLIQSPALLPDMNDVQNIFNPTYVFNMAQATQDALSKNALTKFMLWQARPTEPHTFALHTIGSETKKAWNEVKHAIDRGAPILLGLILVQSNNPVAAVDNHQVVATGYAFNEQTKDVQLYVYDPKHKNFTSTILFNIGLAENQIRASQTVPGGIIPVRGFFANPVGSGPPMAQVYSPAQTTPQRSGPTSIMR